MLTYDRVRFPLAAGVAHQSRLCGFLELLEPSRQPVSIRPIHTSPRQLDHLPDDPLEAEFEKRAIMDFEQAVSDMDAKIRINADQVSRRFMK